MNVLALIEGTFELELGWEDAFVAFESDMARDEFRRLFLSHYQNTIKQG